MTTEYAHTMNSNAISVTGATGARQALTAKPVNRVIIKVIGGASRAAGVITVNRVKIVKAMKAG